MTIQKKCIEWQKKTDLGDAAARDDELPVNAYISIYLCVHVFLCIHTYTLESAVSDKLVYGQRFRPGIKGTLQHTASHCNTLQHTAAHCSTLQHTATPFPSVPRRHALKHKDAVFQVTWQILNLSNKSPTFPQKSLIFPPKSSIWSCNLSFSPRAQTEGNWILR